MVEVVLIALISAGVITALRGLLTMRGKRRANVTFIERPLIDALALKKEAQVVQVLGRLRLVYGLFLTVVGIWGLISL
jgi:hypothetical protein